MAIGSSDPICLSALEAVMLADELATASGKKWAIVAPRGKSYLRVIPVGRAQNYKQILEIVG